MVITYGSIMTNTLLTRGTRLDTLFSRKTSIKKKHPDYSNRSYGLLHMILNINRLSLL